MLLGPFTHEAKRPARKPSCQDFAGIDHDERLVSLVLHVDMCGAMVGVIHAHVDAEEEGDDGHLRCGRFVPNQGLFDCIELFAQRRIRPTKVARVFDWRLRKAASFIDTIPIGAKLADLSVERPTRFELVLNIKVAKALRLTIPQALLLRADEVIQ